MKNILKHIGNAALIFAAIPESMLAGFGIPVPVALLIKGITSSVQKFLEKK